MIKTKPDVAPELPKLATDARYAAELGELRGLLQRWMEETGDPLLEGPIEPPEGAELNDPDGISASERPITHSIRA